jgi:acyl carrier protein
MVPETYVKVAKLIAEQLNIEESKVSHNISFDALGADSLDQIEILMRSEEVFNIEISDEESENIVCVKDLVDCIEKVSKSVEK